MLQGVRRSDERTIGRYRQTVDIQAQVGVGHRDHSGQDADVVAAAGISGALTAEVLIRQGCDVLILGRRPPVRGSTIASTAMIQHEIDVPLIRLQKQIGVRTASAA